MSRIGWAGGSRSGIEMPIAASVTFHPLGGKFVIMNSDGRATLLITASATVFGWLEAPTSWGATTTHETNGYWTASSTAAKDGKFLCLTSTDAKFIMPISAANTGTFAQARVGEACDIVGVATDGSVQYATLATISTKVLIVEGPVNEDDNLAIVRMNPAKIQQDAS